MSRKQIFKDGHYWIKLDRTDIAVLLNALDDHIKELKQWYEPDQRFEEGQLLKHAKELWSDFQALDDIIKKAELLSI